MALGGVSLAHEVKLLAISKVGAAPQLFRFRNFWVVFFRVPPVFGTSRIFGVKKNAQKNASPHPSMAQHTQKNTNVGWVTMKRT